MWSFPPLIGLAHLLLATLLCSSSQVLGFSTDAAKEVANFPEFQKAFLNPSVQVIRLTANIIFPPDGWAKNVNLSRNLLITATDSLRILDFNGTSRKLFITPNATLTFKGMSLNGSSWWEPGYQPINFGEILSYSPDAVVVFENTQIYAQTCAPIQQSAVALEGIARTFLRAPKCPAGVQQVTFRRYCNLEKCYRNGWWHTDFCIQPPELDVPKFGLTGQHYEVYKRTYLLCKVNMFSYPCPRKSIKAPTCLDPADPANNKGTPSPSNSTTAAASKAKSTSKESDDSNAAIIAIAVAVPLVVLIIAIMLFVFRRKIFHKTSPKKDQLPVTEPLGKPAAPASKDIDSSHGQYPPPTTASYQSGPDSLKVRLTDGSADVTSVHSGVLDDTVELSSMLGRGSFGSVFRGRWRNQVVAVKILQHDSQQLQQIQNEAHLNSCLNHSNVATALQIIHKRLGSTPKPPSDVQGTTDQSDSIDLESSAVNPDMMETWIIMDLCDQGSLEGLSRKGTFRRNERLFLHPLLLRLRDVAAGMTYMHAKNICHGDLKAGNVLVASSEADPFRCVAKVADFGLSRVLLSAQSHLSTKTMGTPSRMPPELLLKGQLSPAGDVYAFGILMYEVATGQLPFQSMAIGELIHRVVMNHERPILPPYVPKQYADLANACWVPERENRPAFKQVLLALDGMLMDLEALQKEVDSFDYDAYAAAATATNPQSRTSGTFKPPAARVSQ